jgi:hypothetical protein
MNLEMNVNGGILPTFRNSRRPHRYADLLFYTTDIIIPQLSANREAAAAAMPEQELGIYFGGLS